MGKHHSKAPSEEVLEQVKSTKQSLNTREKLRTTSSVRRPWKIDEKVSRYFVEHTILIWLDASSFDKSEATQGILNQFRRLTHLIESFNNVDNCLQFLNSIENENVFIVVSGSLGQIFVQRLTNLSTIQAIYVFCGNKANHEQWVKAYPIIKGVFTNIKLLCDTMGQMIRQVDYSLTSITLLPEGLPLDINSSNADFYALQLMKNIILQQSHDLSLLKNLINYARPFYENHPYQLAVIDNWKDNYNQHAPIWWYTKKCFVHHMLRKAFQYNDYALMYHLAYFIRDLHRDIKKSYLQLSSHQRRSMSLYRAAHIDKEQFRLIEKSPRTLLAFNDFVLTTLEKQIALNFAKRISNQTNRTVTVLYRMDIDPKESTIPYVPLDNLSYKSNDNSEVLLSMNTIFSVGQVTPIGDNLYEVILDPIDRKDERISQVVEILSESIMGLTGWFQISRVFIDVKKYRPLEQIYQSLFNETDPSQRRERAFLQHELAYVAEIQGQWTKAIEHYQQSIMISLSYTTPKDRSLRSTYINLAKVLEQIGDLNGAIENCQKAMTILVAEDPTIIYLHLFLGNLLQQQNNSFDSQLNYEKARTILQHQFPSAEPILADIYHSIAGGFFRAKDYNNALTFYEKTIAIDEKKIGFYHPSSAIAYFNLATVYQTLNKIDQAIEFAKKALDVSRKIYGEEHEETKENLEFYQKLLQQNKS